MTLGQDSAWATTRDEGFRQVLVWRSRAIGVRALQALLIAALAWFATGNGRAIVWLAAVLATATLDAQLSRRVLERPAPAWLKFVLCVSLVLSAITFASVALVLLSRPSHLLLATAEFILCAVILNNAVMTRGSRLAFVLLTPPSATVLMTSPFIAAVKALDASGVETLALAVGAAAFCVFVVRLAGFLHRENRDLRRALQEETRQRHLAAAAGAEAQQGRRRWHMAFRQSPLPHTCFDASTLYDLVRDEAELRERPLGDIVRNRLSSYEQARGCVRLIEVNSAADGLLKQPWVQARRRPNEDFFGALCTALNSIDGDGVMPPFETTLERADGQMRDVQVYARMPFNQDRPWSLCVATYLDITDVKRAARVEREAREAAEAANRAKSAFSATMSHEIRTPLNGVLGMAQALTHERLTKAQRERVDVILRSSEALCDVLDDVLEISLLEAGELAIAPAPFQLDTLLASLEAQFGAAAKAKGLAFQLRVAPGAGGAFCADAPRIWRLLAKLLDNAVKFTDSGCVTLAVSGGPSGCRFVVSDTGVGVHPHRLPNLFERFVQADSSATRRFGGAGLGLAICKELAEAMRGRIEAQSELGRGSSFAVELPLRRIAAAPVRSSPPPSAQPELRVLAAEDNAVNQLVLATLLQQVGVTPVIVGNGAEAVTAWRETEWDLILMDIQMPLMDGCSAARLIREEERKGQRRRTPIIAVTANALSHQVARYRADGMDAVVSKPINAAELFAAIAAVEA
ncbi:MAG TPA: ATP-binding protein [Caulobacteraceae bacterium]|jgi:signal transduction histidine kinase/CheY-like chemotaxis protein